MSSAERIILELDPYPIVVERDMAYQLDIRDLIQLVSKLKARKVPLEVEESKTSLKLEEEKLKSEIKPHELCLFNVWLLFVWFNFKYKCFYINRTLPILAISKYCSYSSKYYFLMSNVSKIQNLEIKQLYNLGYYAKYLDVTKLIRIKN